MEAGDGSLAHAVAEQVWVAAPIQRVRNLLTERPLTWLEPLVILAWRDGLAAAVLVGVADPANATPAAHVLDLGPAVDVDGGVRFAFEWRAVHASEPFSRLRGHLGAVENGRACVLHLVGNVEGVPRPKALVRGTFPAESAVRSLLGCLRAAVELPIRLCD